MWTCQHSRKLVKLCSGNYAYFLFVGEFLEREIWYQVPGMYIICYFRPTTPTQGCNQTTDHPATPYVRLALTCVVEGDTKDTRWY